MRIRVTSPGGRLTDSDVQRIERDLEKIDRRLSRFKEVDARVTVTGDGGARGYQCLIELDYGRSHLLARTDHSDVGQAVRIARDEILRQVNDRSRGGHSSMAKGR